MPTFILKILIDMFKITIELNNEQTKTKNLYEMYWFLKCKQIIKTNLF